MEKKFLLIAVYFTLTGACVCGQNKEKNPPQAFIELPAPIINLVAAPPVEPLPPPPPPKAVVFKTPVIVNNNGYDIFIQKNNRNEMIFIEKGGVRQKIKLSTWNANRKFYEKKYGQLPQPPPTPLPEKQSYSLSELVPDTQ